MLNAEFNKETFKNSVRENVKMLYRKNLEEASQQEIYQAVCYAVKDDGGRRDDHRAQGCRLGCNLRFARRFGRSRFVPAY